MAKSAPAPRKKTTPKPKSDFSFSKVTLWLHLIVITLVFWYTYSLIFDNKPDLNGDNFAYYLLGQRLAHGLGFTNATDIHHDPHTHFPPGYPALLSVFMRTIGDDQDSLNFMNGLMMYGSLLILYFLIKKLTSSPALAFAGAFITALNSHLLRSATITMSEIPFLFFSLLAIYSFVRAVDDPRILKSPWLYVSVISIVICYHTKTTALALIGGVVVYLLFAKEWSRLLVVVLGFGLLCMPWYLRNKNLKDFNGKPIADSHFGQLMQVDPYQPELGNLTKATFINRVKVNFNRYVSNDIPLSLFALDINMPETQEAFQRSQDQRRQILANSANEEFRNAKTEAEQKAIKDRYDHGVKKIDNGSPTAFWTIGILIICFTLWGIYRLKNFRLLFLGYFGGTLAILLIWPEIWGGIRFIEPLVPFALFLALYAVKEIIAIPLGEKNTAFVPYSFLLLGFLYTKPIDVLEQKAAERMPSNYVNYFEMAKWAKNNTPKDAIFSARKPDMFMYYADRTCIGDKPSLDDKVIMDFFNKNDVSYVVIEHLGFSSTPRYLIPAFKKNRDKFDDVLKIPEMTQSGTDTSFLLKIKK